MQNEFSAFFFMRALSFAGDASMIVPTFADIYAPYPIGIYPQCFSPPGITGSLVSICHQHIIIASGHHPHGVVVLYVAYGDRTANIYRSSYQHAIPGYAIIGVFIKAPDKVICRI